MNIGYFISMQIKIALHLINLMEIKKYHIILVSKRIYYFRSGVHG
jgi:hypothetical protein